MEWDRRDLVEGSGRHNLAKPRVESAGFRSVYMTFHLRHSAVVYHRRPTRVLKLVIAEAASRAERYKDHAGAGFL